MIRSIMSWILHCSLCVLAVATNTNVTNILSHNTTTTNNNNNNDDPNTIHIAGIFDTNSFSWGNEIFEFVTHAINTQPQQPPPPSPPTTTLPPWLPPNILPTTTTTLTYTISNAACDETTAVRSYWSLRTTNTSTQPRPHGIIGCRCSGASISLARIAGLEGVPQVSPWSTSAKLSDDEEFPFFSRLVGPDDAGGEVGALVALLRGFGWERVSTLTVVDSGRDTLYAKGLEREFGRLWVGVGGDDVDGDGDGGGGYEDYQEDNNNHWKGQIAHSATIDLYNNNADGIQRTLRTLISDDIPAPVSRVIVLFANNDDAWPVLRTASDMEFGRGDTVWIGVSAWIGRMPPSEEEDGGGGGGTVLDWLNGPQTPPGYLGLTYYFNRDGVYDDFMGDLRRWQRENGRLVWVNDVPSVIVQYMVDSIVSLVTAIGSVEVEERRNGQLITSNLRQQQINGVSGPYAFSPEGDRLNARFTILNLHYNNDDDDDDDDDQDNHNNYKWVEIGSTGVTPGTSSILRQKLCLAQYGCNPDSIPSDSYPEPKEPVVSVWGIAIVISLCVLLVGVAGKYWRSKRSKRNIRRELEVFRKSVVGMSAVEVKYIPVYRKGGRDVPDDVVVQWCWQETSHMMNNHHLGEVVGDPKDCWIKYDNQSNSRLETAYQKQNRKGTYHLITPHGISYTIDFSVQQQQQQHMVQTKTSTGFRRNVKRFVQTQTHNNTTQSSLLNHDDYFYDNSAPPSNNSKSTKRTKKLQQQPLVKDNIKWLTIEAPKDLEGEPKMVLVQDDIVRISKQRSDGWAFGTKLYHANEAVARELIEIAKSFTSPTSEDEEENEILTDTGWFQPKPTTRIPTANDLTAMRNNVGDAGALRPPSHWDPIKDPSVVQKHTLQPGHPEYDAVVKAFESTLVPPRYRKTVRVLRVERVQNLSSYQSYVVKRQTVLNRELQAAAALAAGGGAGGGGGGGAGGGRNVRYVPKVVQERFERRWLWHGTNFEVMDKILQQGFNRSFCGKNATVYGKGVYFARDAQYSAYPTYAVPDRDGCQYIMACRVVVGEYCVGRTNALTPDVRDIKSHRLYDSTVGLLDNDTMANPSIYVTYHDAQAYPDYLIKFRAS